MYNMCGDIKSWLDGVLWWKSVLDRGLSQWEMDTCSETRLIEKTQLLSLRISNSSFASTSSLPNLKAMMLMCQ